MLGQLSKMILLIWLLLFCQLPPHAASLSLQSRRQTLDQFIDQFYAAYRRKDIELLASFYAEDVYFEDPTFDLIFKSKAQVRSMLEQSMPHYSDIEWHIENRVIGDNQVAVVGTFSARFNAKPFGGVRFATFLTFQSGKIIRHIDFFDKGALEKQLKDSR